MNRMGHSSTRAAQVYLHARQDRDREIASSLDKMAARELKKSKKNKKRRKPKGVGHVAGTVADEQKRPRVSDKSLA